MTKTKKKYIDYITGYNKKNTVAVCLRMNKKYDGDIIDRLAEQRSKAGYIKALIRADIERG